MMKHVTTLSIALVLLMVLFAGCGMSQQAQQPDEQEQALPMATVTADCVAHYYKTGAAGYMTSQRHGFNPVEGFFQAVSTEPVGAVQCSLMKGDFDSSGPENASLSDLPQSFWNRNLAVGVFYSFCAGGGLLDGETMDSGKDIKIEGQWYMPLAPRWPTDISVTLLRSLDTKRIELIQLDDPRTETTWLLRNYNLVYSKDLSRRLPRAVDVYDIRNGVASKELMMRFNYTAVRKEASH